MWMRMNRWRKKRKCGKCCHTIATDARENEKKRKKKCWDEINGEFFLSCTCMYYTYTCLVIRDTQFNVSWIACVVVVISFCCFGWFSCFQYAWSSMKKTLRQLWNMEIQIDELFVGIVCGVCQCEWICSSFRLFDNRSILIWKFRQKKVSFLHTNVSPSMKFENSLCQFQLFRHFSLPFR